MTLHEYMDKNAKDGLRTQEEWANYLGISRSYLCQILSGERVPGRKTIEQIAHATNGDVSVTVWFIGATHDAA